MTFHSDKRSKGEFGTSCWCLFGQFSYAHHVGSFPASCPFLLLQIFGTRHTLELTANAVDADQFTDRKATGLVGLLPTSSLAVDRPLEKTHWAGGHVYQGIFSPGKASKQVRRHNAFSVIAHVTITLALRALLVFFRALADQWQYYVRNACTPT